MAQTPVTTGNHSLMHYNGWSRYKRPATVLWGSTANTCVITDGKIRANAAVLVWVTGTTPAAGRWSQTAGDGNLTITSTDGESATLPLSYVVL